jgi:thiamine biosynthesis lipoprotein
VRRRSTLGPLWAAMIGLGAALGAAPAPGADAPADSAAALAVSRSREVLGTRWTVTAEAADTAGAGGAIDRALNEAAQLEGALGPGLESEVTRLNALSGGMWVPCSPALYAALDSSLALARLTDGAFDPTIEPLNRAWNVRGKGRLPSAFDTERALTLVGWSKVSLDPQSRRAFLSFTGMGVDLGGIGVGLAMDRTARRLAQADVRRALIRSGGRALALGEGWEVAVGPPARPTDPAVRIPIADAAVATASADERRRVIKRKSYSRLIDPRTGQPVEGRGSVTVVAGSATRAGALSTALLVMGREQAAVFAGRRPELGVLWLEASGDTLRAWRWNLESARAEPGVRIEWMN